MIGRQLAFAARMPPRKIAARLALLAKRNLLARAAPLLPGIGLRHAAEPLAAALPAGLFGPGASLETPGEGRFAFTFIGERREFGLPIDWHLAELKTGTRLWLLNLHYMDYLAEADDEAFVALLLDWIAGNPGYGPAYWTYNWNSYALSIRTVAIMKEIARRRERLPRAALATILRSLTSQIRFLERNLETDIGGNHIVKNIKALVWAGAFFAGPRAARWRRLGIALLARELDRQILADGLHFERSPSYHAQVFADLLEIRHALGSDPLGGRLDRALARMAAPLADLVHPDGGPPLFGDAGLNMGPSPDRCLDACRAVLGRSAAPQPVFAYRDGGYYGVRTDSYYLVADMGPIGPAELPAHAHGDIGSFELSVGAERLIVDQGVFEYSAGERRRLSRTAASHNVLHIEGGDQAAFFGAFRCGRMPGVEAEFEPLPGGFRLSGSHDGYADLPGGPRVERSIAAGPDAIVFHDRILGGGGASAAIALLLHPEARVEAAPGGLTVRRGAAGFALVSDLEVIIEEAVYWPDMGVERPTRRIRLRLPPDCHEARWQLRPFWNEKHT